MLLKSKVRITFATLIETNVYAYFDISIEFLLCIIKEETSLLSLDMSQRKSKRHLSLLQKYSYETNKRLRDKCTEIQNYEVRERTLRENILEKRRANIKKMMEYLRRKPSYSQSEIKKLDNVEKHNFILGNMNLMQIQTSLQENPLDHFDLTMSLLNLEENCVQEENKLIASHSQVSTHTPRKTLKFVIPPQPCEKNSFNASELTCRELSPQLIKSSDVLKKNFINSATHNIRGSNHQGGSTVRTKDFEENPSNHTSTDDEISSLILDVNNTTPRSTPCDIPNCKSSGSWNAQSEGTYSSSFIKEKEINQNVVKAAQQKTYSASKHTRSILKSRSLSPKTHPDNTCESFQNKVCDTLYGPSDSVDLTNVRFQIGCISPYFGGNNSSNENVVNTCNISLESTNIESPRTARKTVRFADETSDFIQTYPESMNPIFSNVFPLRIIPDVDDTISVFGSDTSSSIEENLAQIPEKSAFHDYGPATSVDSSFISISIGLLPNQPSELITTNSTNLCNTKNVNYLKIDEATNHKPVPTNEYTVENSDKQNHEYSTIVYESLKPTGKMNNTPKDKLYPTPRINSSRVINSQGYADLLIGRPKLHDDFLIPRQQLLTYKVSLNHLFSRPSNGYQSGKSPKLSYQDGYRFNTRSNNCNVLLPGPLNSSLSTKISTLETSQTPVSTRTPCTTSALNNRQVCNAAKYSNIDNKTEILLTNYSADSNSDNNHSIQRRDIDLPDYEGIDLPFSRNKTPTPLLSPSSSSTLTTVAESNHCRDHSSDTEHYATLLPHQMRSADTKMSKSDRNNSTQITESYKFSVNIQHKPNLQSSIPLYTASARLLERRPRICEPSAVNVYSSNPHMFMSAYEFETVQPKVNAYENSLKSEKSPIIFKSSSNQNATNNLNTCWFRLHNGYSEEINSNSAKNQLSINIRNQPATFTQSDELVNQSGHCDYDNVTNLSSKCVTPSTFRLTTTPVVTKLFGPKIECATYTQVHDVTQSLTEFLHSELECQQQQPQYQQESKLRTPSTLQPVPIEPNVLSQSPNNIRSKTVILII
ncbi:hypothetical protein KSF78_0002816 [Schistosoma japonicum]|nr:hypothetical protein KSF78_0002816 [Schistosoma japonicum]